MNTATIFDSFNARGLIPAQVAQTFVPPESFDRLLKARHSLIIGPRGSGKTTLLKMLQLPALQAWSHPTADSVRSTMTFVGVFVPADISWQAQIMSLGAGQLPGDAHARLGFSAFVTHSLKAVVEAIQQACDPRLRDVQSLAHLHLEISREREREIVRHIAETWRIPLAIESLLTLQLALSQRLADIARIANEQIGLKTERIDETLRGVSYLNLGFLESISSAIEAVSVLSKKQDLKWALLFDELEIAPVHIQDVLVKAVRSTDPRLLLKLSLSPYSGEINTLSDPAGPMAGHDYDPIYLSQLAKDVHNKFTRDLCTSILNGYGVTDVDVENVFQQNPLSPPEQFSRSERSRYAVGRPLHRTFKELSRIDHSFRAYLREAQVSLDSIANLPEDQRAQSIRKVTPIVVVREALLSSQRVGAPSLLRSRKRRLHYGTVALFAVVEGNPRWIIGLLGPLLRDFSIARVKISATKQQKAIEVATSRFRALLKTIPYEIDSLNPTNRGLLGLIDNIGTSLMNRIVRDKFQAEPPLSFTVDSNISNHIHDALGKAQNAGAIVADTPDDQPIGSLRGKRCRLSYMLASYYNLPLILGRPVALTHLIGERRARSEYSAAQPQLFPEGR